MENENEGRKPTNWKYGYGKSFWLLKGLKVILIVALVGTIMTYIVMMLWNWLMPMIFNLSVINFWQAAGILILAKIFFGFSRWGGGHHWGRQHYYWKEKMEERLKNMTPEERERFRAEWKQRCGVWGKHYDWGAEKKAEEESKA